METKKNEVVKNDAVEAFNRDAEIQKLKAEIEALKEAESFSADSELANLQDMANSSSLNAMPFTESNHKTVFLYKEMGDRMGPFHPANAQDIMRRWASRGFRLYTRPRTAEQIEAYKKSPLHQQRLLEREEANKKRKAYGKRGVNQMAADIAKETGRAVVNELVNVKSINK